MSFTRMPPFPGDDSCSDVLTFGTSGTNGPMSLWIAQQFPEGYRGHCIDVGASDGFNVNSTYILEKWLKWQVISVEPNPYFKDCLTHNRAFVELCACSDKPAESAKFYVNPVLPEAGSALQLQKKAVLVGSLHSLMFQETQVPVSTVSVILEKWQFPKLDVLCMDVEGHEKQVIAGANLGKWKPQVIVAESWDEGGLDSCLKGYRRVYRHEHNDCYLLLG